MNSLLGSKRLATVAAMIFLAACGASTSPGLDDVSSVDTGVTAHDGARDVMRDAGSDVQVIVDDFELPDEGPPWTGDDGGGCNTLVPMGSQLQASCLPDMAPIARGGVIAPGPYVLARLNLYGPMSECGALGTVGPFVLALDGSILQVASIMDGGLVRASYAYRTNGTTFTETPVCPETGESQSVSYTADANTFRIIVDLDSQTTVEEIFVRTP